LDLLGFIRLNQDFSMGYRGKNKKNLVSFRLAAWRLGKTRANPAGRQP